MKNKLISGAFWMSFGSIFSRVLGIIYLIPWLMMFGKDQNQAQAVFNSAYTPYSLFLALGTAGFPTAIARQVASYNSQNKFRNSLHVFKYGFLFMVLTGAICGLLLYLTAPLIAAHSSVVSKDAATTAIYYLVPTMVILPPMSFIRGFFQGNQDMKPFGVSQLWEQFVRVLFILGATFIVLKVFHGDYTEAVNYSTLATLVGTIASYLYLLNYSRSKLPEYRLLYQESAPLEKQNIRKLFQSIIADALPFVFVGAGITIAQFFDQITFKSVVTTILGATVQQAELMYTYFAANPNKITTVVVSLTIAISETTLPLLARYYDRKDKHKISEVIGQNIDLMLLVLAPTVTLLVALSWEVNGIFFQFDSYGAKLLAAALVSSISLALFTDFFTIIQAMRKHRAAVRYLIVGLILKLVLQIPCVSLWGAFGAIISTFVAFLAASLLAFKKISADSLLPGQLQNSARIIIANLLLCAGTLVVQYLLSLIYLPHTKITAFLYAGIFTILFGFTYLLVLDQTQISQCVLNKTFILKKKP
ncbi:putative polysaccharide biosynthesis protein [Liquorilactobacillus capillatus]|uniref:Polysaccharide biosynthesis protein n=1 Tax=Liquorilactobacillus capillatus DSM 19910 TaxID=1423731 RepID=A0A0R1M5Q5_9LACO|nr:polysaccharide biosynthesis protein [Liquorilactobacillus capillatus]KRL03169.1 polysaccharide biosynthesis protein [Liquorilactobacillus capillatus DSM 19910]